MAAGPAGGGAGSPTRSGRCVAPDAHLAYWITDFQLGKRLVAHALSEYDGSAMRSAPAARCADSARSPRLLTTSPPARTSSSRCPGSVAGSEPDIGTTLLHLGSLLADESLVVESGPMLHRALAIAQRGADPLAEGHALAALTLSLWRAGDLDEAARRREARALGVQLARHRPTEGTVAYRLAAVSRGLGRPAEARRYAQVALAASRLSGTRTTALANVTWPGSTSKPATLGPRARTSRWDSPNWSPPPTVGSSRMPRGAGSPARGARRPSSRRHRRDRRADPAGHPATGRTYRSRRCGRHCPLATAPAPTRSRPTGSPWMPPPA